MNFNFLFISLALALSFGAPAALAHTEGSKPLCGAAAVSNAVEFLRRTADRPNAARFSFGNVGNSGHVGRPTSCIDAEYFNVELWSFPEGVYTKVQSLECVHAPAGLVNNRHDVEFHGLKPDTLYYFKVGAVHAGRSPTGTEVCHVHDDTYTDNYLTSTSPQVGDKGWIEAPDEPAPETPSADGAPSNAQICRTLDLLGQIVCNNHKGYGDCLSDGTWDHSFGRDACPAF